MRWIILFLILSLSSNSQTFKVPPLRNGGDKIVHFAVSYTLTYNSYNYLKNKMPKRRAKIYSTLIATGAGIAKEIIDEKWRKGYELGDITANSFGISFALLTIDF